MNPLTLQAQKLLIEIAKKMEGVEYLPQDRRADASTLLNIARKLG